MSTTLPRKGTIAETAEYYAVSTKTVRRWIAAGLIHAERVGPHLIRVDIDSMQTTPLQPSKAGAFA